MVYSLQKISLSYKEKIFVLLAIVYIFSTAIAEAQDDPHVKSGPLKIQKLILEKDSSFKNDSLINVKIEYNKADGSLSVLNVRAKYVNSGSNNDNADTASGKTAIIYDGESREKREVTPVEVRQIVEQIIQNPPPDITYFVNGTESSAENIKKLDPAKIKTINVYNRRDAIEKYGEKIKNGVIVLTTF